MMSDIKKILQDTGPTRSSVIVERLVKQANIPNATARQRVARVSKPITKFQIPLLPKRENFIYLEKDYDTELFWKNLLNALRETNAIYALAIDGLINRGGTIEIDEFPVISGAPIALKKQVTCDMVIDRLIKAKIIETKFNDETEYVSIVPYDFIPHSTTHHKKLRLVENIILEGLHNWVRKISLASYDSIRIRGDAKKPPVGQFMWDLTAPSYILPMKPMKEDDRQNGFIVADVFVQGQFTEKDVKYFIRKTQLLQASQKDIKFIPILIAEAFDSNALKKCRGAGIMPIAINNIFGNDVAEAIKTLIYTLNNAATIATQSPEKLTDLLNSLSKIKGASGNLIGVLFELICVYLARSEATDVKYSTTFFDQKTKKFAEIDVLRIVGNKKCTAIECKGKEPGGVVNRDTVEKWLKQLSVFRTYLKGQDRFRETHISFELWTAGTFSEDAIKLLNEQKALRTTHPIDWKNINDILNMATNSKEKGIADALKEHYINDPLNP